MKPNKKTGKIPANEKSKKKLMAMQPDFRKYLQSPGPDLAIFDEGHKLKNVESAISQTVALLETKRRVCLTGTPMQNNLIEYYCMTNFVKGNLLGEIKEFKMRFETPIKKGQMRDSDVFDVNMMRRRCHVLYTKLQGVIDRKDFNILKESLLPKYEYVINVRLTEKQLQLYQLYLDQECSSFNSRRKKLLANYHIFARISTHPFQVVIHQEEVKASQDSDLDDTIESEKEDEEEAVPIDPETVDKTPIDWYKHAGIVQEEDRGDYSQSYKLLFLIEIIKQCEMVGDKLLVFSQSLESLRLIKRTLEALAPTWFDDGHKAVLKKSHEQWGWKLNKDFLVINGSISSKDRDVIQKQFNRVDKPQIRICLISTKAGSLGTNFVGANRVVIFDQSWNPSHDRQALFRTYRFGQVKPVFIYRLVAHGTIEDRIYARQVTKESMSGRVIDEHQIRRHFIDADLSALYQLKIDEYDENKPPLYTVPEDELLANVFMKLKEGIVNCLQHDSLLAHNEEEALTPEEMKLAWEEFESKKQGEAETQLSQNVPKNAYLARGNFEVPTQVNTATPNFHEVRSQVSNMIKLSQVNNMIKRPQVNNMSKRPQVNNMSKRPQVNNMSKRPQVNNVSKRPGILDRIKKRF